MNVAYKSWKEFQTTASKPSRHALTPITTQKHKSTTHHQVFCRTHGYEPRESCTIPPPSQPRLQSGRCTGNHRGVDQWSSWEMHTWHLRFNHAHSTDIRKALLRQSHPVGKLFVLHWPVLDSTVARLHKQLIANTLDFPVLELYSEQTSRAPTPPVHKEKISHHWWETFLRISRGV